VSTITRKDTKLALEPIGQPVLELEQTGEADFAIPKFDLVLCFEQIEDGAAKRLVIWQRGTALRLARTDASLRVPGPCPAQARARRPPAQAPLSIEFWAPTYACEIKWPV
jgi:hypothetical protein